jgi:hypothetical protein
MIPRRSNCGPLSFIRPLVLAGCSSPKIVLIPTYRQYYRPIDLRPHLRCNRSIAADSIGLERHGKKMGLPAPFACQEEIQ